MSKHLFVAACPCGGARVQGDEKLRKLAIDSKLECGGCGRRLKWDETTKTVVWRRKEGEALN